MNGSNWSRRSFMKMSAAALAASSVTKLLSAADAPAADEFGGLLMGLQSYTLRSMPFDKAMETLGKTLMLHVTEIFPNHIAALSPDKVKEILSGAA